MLLLRAVWSSILAAALTVGFLGHLSAAFASDDRNDARVNGAAWFHWQKMDFDLLEKWAAEARDTKRALETRHYMASSFYFSFWSGQDVEGFDAIDASWEAVLNEWTKAKPGSPTPHLAHAAMRYHRASLYRGDGYVQEVPRPRLNEAAKYWSEARDYLLKHRHIADLDYF